MRDDQQNCECTDTVTVTLPECSGRCFGLGSNSINCIQLPSGDRSYEMIFNLKNNSDCEITSALFDTCASTGITLAPESYSFDAAIRPGIPPPV